MELECLHPLIVGGLEAWDEGIEVVPDGRSKYIRIVISNAKEERTGGLITTSTRVLLALAIADVTTILPILKKEFECRRTRKMLHDRHILPCRERAALHGQRQQHNAHVTAKIRELLLYFDLGDARRFNIGKIQKDVKRLFQPRRQRADCTVLDGTVRQYAKNNVGKGVDGVEISGCCRHASVDNARNAFECNQRLLTLLIGSIVGTNVALEWVTVLNDCLCAIYFRIPLSSNAIKHLFIAAGAHDAATTNETRWGSVGCVLPARWEIRRTDVEDEGNCTRIRVTAAMANATTMEAARTISTRCEKRHLYFQMGSGR